MKGAEQRDNVGTIETTSVVFPARKKICMVNICELL